MFEDLVIFYSYFLGFFLENLEDIKGIAILLAIATCACLLGITTAVVLLIAVKCNLIKNTDW